MPHNLTKLPTNVHLVLQVTSQQIGTPEVQTLLDSFALTAQPFTLVVEEPVQLMVNFQAIANTFRHIPEIPRLPKQPSYRESAYQRPRYGPPHPGKVRGPQR